MILQIPNQLEIDRMLSQNKSAFSQGNIKSKLFPLLQSILIWFSIPQVSIFSLNNYFPYQFIYTYSILCFSAFRLSLPPFFTLNLFTLNTDEDYSIFFSFLFLLLLSILNYAKWFFIFGHLRKYEIGIHDWLLSSIAFRFRSVSRLAGLRQNQICFFINPSIQPQSSVCAGFIYN